MKSVQKEKQQIKFWFYSSERIEKIGNKFSLAFNSKIIDTDFENVFEWSQQTTGDIYINISRNHTKVRIRSPILIYFQHYDFDDEQIKSFGVKLRAVFQTHIYRGNYIVEINNDLVFLEVFEIYN